MAGEPPPGSGYPGMQELRGHDTGPARVPDGLHQEHLWGHAVSPWGEQGPQAPHDLGSRGGGSTRPHCNQTICSLCEADSGTR